MTDARQRHVLVVDDDPVIRDMLSTYLGANEFQVTTRESGHELPEVVASQHIDLVVLDLRLGREDGIRVAMDLRARSDVPIIILTGRLDEADRVMGLELAADDYITKPFSPRELLARARAVLRRARSSARATIQPGYRFSGWRLEVARRRLVPPAGDPIALTGGELNLMLAFLKAPGRVLTRDQLLQMSRLRGDEVYDRSVDVQVLRLRRKLASGTADESLIRTARGTGYYLDAVVDETA